jgi:hypothetical protein
MLYSTGKVKIIFSWGPARAVAMVRVDTNLWRRDK